jgi:uncharacterized coiled-coil protein SlyX
VTDVALWAMFALALLTIVLVLTGTGLVLAWRRQRQLQQRLAALEARVALQGQSVGGLTSGTHGVDQRLTRLEARERLLGERLDVFESEQAEDRPYNQAIRLVRQGAGGRRLIEELGLSESEAELIVRLHADPQPARVAGT